MSKLFIEQVNKILTALAVEGSQHAEPALETLNAMFAAFQEDLRLLDDDVRESQRDDLIEAHRVFYSAGLTIIGQIAFSNESANSCVQMHESEQSEEPEQVKDVEMAEGSFDVVQITVEAQPPPEKIEPVPVADIAPTQPNVIEVEQNNAQIPVVQVSFEEQGAWGSAEEVQPSTSKEADKSKGAVAKQSLPPRVAEISEMAPGVSVENSSQLSYLDYERLMRPFFVLQPIERVDERALNEILVAISDVRARASELHFSMDKEWRWIFALIQSRMDMVSRSLWEWQLDREEPTLDGFINFLLKRSNRLHPHQRYAARAAQPSTSRASSVGHSGDNQPTATQKPKKSKSICVNCGGDHFLHKCDGFKALSIKQKRAVLELHRLCHNCFSSAHLTGACSQGACKRCQTKHNSLVCPRAPKDKDKGEK